MPKQPIQAVIFDMDGVLCDSEPFITRAGVTLFAREHDLQVQYDDFKPFTGMGDGRFIEGVAEKYGLAIDVVRDKEKLYDYYLESIDGVLEPLPGAKAFVAVCHQRGLKLAVASAADRRKVEGNLKQLGLDVSLFGAIVTGSDVAKKKPDPEGFLLAAKQLGVEPAYCLVVEDAVAGVQAAKAMDAWALGITTTFAAEDLRSAGADETAGDLRAGCGLLSASND